MNYPGAILKLDSTGPAVSAIQGRVGVLQTGTFGPTTEAAVRDFQSGRGISSNGMVGPTTWAALFGVPGQISHLPFVQAAHFHSGRQGKPIKLLVIHTMEAPERNETAENVAQYFKTTPTLASAHFCIDNNSIVQCVHDNDTAFAAPGANNTGLHFEHAGYAAQSAQNWSDAYSDDMLWLSARLVAAKAALHGIPIAWLSPSDLSAGKKGITSHRNCTQAFGGSHTDPGVNFPIQRYLTYVQLGASFP